MVDVPRHGQIKPLTNALCGRVTQQTLCLADVGQTVAERLGLQAGLELGECGHNYLLLLLYKCADECWRG